MAQKVRDVMAQNLRTVSKEDSVADAARTMRDADIGDVIVLTENEQLCGIVTDRDIAIRAVAEGRDPKGTSVDEICSHEVTALSPDEDVKDAAKIMRDRAVRRLPVVEAGNARPVGIVSIADLAIERDPDSAVADISAAPGNQ